MNSGWRSRYLSSVGEFVLGWKEKHRAKWQKKQQQRTTKKISGAKRRQRNISESGGSLTNSSIVALWTVNPFSSCWRELALHYVTQNTHTHQNTSPAPRQESNGLTDAEIKFRAEVHFNQRRDLTGCSRWRQKQKTSDLAANAIVSVDTWQDGRWCNASRAVFEEFPYNFMS